MYRKLSSWYDTVACPRTKIDCLVVFPPIGAGREVRLFGEEAFRLLLGTTTQLEDMAYASVNSFLLNGYVKEKVSIRISARICF